MSKLSVKNLKGETRGSYELADELLVKGKGTQAVHDAVVAHLANKRAGTAATKKRGEVSGGGRKPFRQKGTGQARAGSTRSPIWRGGGVVFGPQPRDYSQRLPAKVARLAFRRAVSDKVAEGGLMLVDELSMSEPKTKLLKSALQTLTGGRPCVVVVEKVDKNLALASRNLPDVEVATAGTLNTYQILRYPLVLVTQSAMAGLENRLRK